jgi:glutaredoxin-related protein
MAMILYSNNCPRCIILERELERLGLYYQKCNNFTKVITTGFRSAPVLEIQDGVMLNFDESLRYLDETEKGRR